MIRPTLSFTTEGREDEILSSFHGDRQGSKGSVETIKCKAAGTCHTRRATTFLHVSRRGRPGK